MNIETALLEAIALAVSFFLGWICCFQLLQSAGGLERSDAARVARRSAGWAAAIALTIASIAGVVGYLTARGA